MGRAEGCRSGYAVTQTLNRLWIGRLLLPS